MSGHEIVVDVTVKFLFFLIFNCKKQSKVSVAKL